MEKKKFDGVRIVRIDLAENTCRLVNRFQVSFTLQKVHPNYNSMFSAALLAASNNLSVDLGCDVDPKDFMKDSKELGGFYEKAIITHLDVNFPENFK